MRHVGDLRFVKPDARHAKSAAFVGAVRMAGESAAPAKEFWAVDEGGVVHAVMWIPEKLDFATADWGGMCEVFVRESSRRLGVGRDVLMMAIYAARARFGIPPEGFVVCTVDARNKAAIALCRSCMPRKITTANPSVEGAPSVVIKFHF